MPPFELRAGTDSNHCLLTQDQSSPAWLMPMHGLGPLLHQRGSGPCCQNACDTPLLGCSNNQNMAQYPGTAWHHVALHDIELHDTAWQSTAQCVMAQHGIA